MEDLTEEVAGPPYEFATPLFQHQHATLEPGKYDQLAEKYAKTADEDPAANRKLAEVLAILGRYKNVIETCSKLMAMLDRQKDSEGTLRAAERLLQLQPDSEEARHKKIQIWYEQGKTGEAIKMSRQLARFALASGNDFLAVDLLERAFKERPDDLEIGMELAQAYTSQGQIVDATNLFRRMGDSSFQRMEYEKAVEAYKRLTVLTPQDTQAYMMLGDIFVKLGQYQEADQQYRAILRQDINNVDALLKVARVSELKGQYRDAQLALSRIIASHPEEYRAQAQLGTVYKRMSMPTEAVKHLLLAALGFLEEGKKPWAMQAFQDVLNIDPNNAIASRQLSVLRGTG